ncbi:hypothetical protein CDAR_375591 [Caerostris darwini]|uniref:Uncharacterized protein n=1 Tax=Caerostris darwini TaxID=1538125 RepID=A0AAV4S703_9ARAC|nr:hypothetical protein CDAR_375591 [Caerostris darwini]
MSLVFYICLPGELRALSFERKKHLGLIDPHFRLVWQKTLKTSPNNSVDNARHLQNIKGNGSYHLSSDRRQQREDPVGIEIGITSLRFPIRIVPWGASLQSIDQDRPQRRRALYLFSKIIECITNPTEQQTTQFLQCRHFPFLLAWPLSVSLFANLLDRIPSGHSKTTRALLPVASASHRSQRKSAPSFSTPLYFRQPRKDLITTTARILFLMADSYPGNEINQLSSTDDDALCPKLYLQQKKGCATISTPVATGCQ